MKWFCRTKFLKPEVKEEMEKQFPNAVLVDESEFKLHIAKMLQSLLDGSISTFIPSSFNYIPSEFKSAFQRVIRKEVEEVIEQRVQTEIQKRIGTEEFLDSIVERIKRKQL